MTSDAHASPQRTHDTHPHKSSRPVAQGVTVQPGAALRLLSSPTRPGPSSASVCTPTLSISLAHAFALSDCPEVARMCPTPTPTNSARRAHVSEGYPHGYPRWCSCSCAGALHAWSHCMHRANGSSGRTSGSEIIPDTADPVIGWGTHARAWPRASPPGSRQTGGAPRGQPLRCSRMYPPSSGGM